MAPVAPHPRADELMDLEIQERRGRLRLMEQQAARAAFELAQTYRDEAARETDERHRLFLTDTAKNVVRIYAPGALLALPAPQGAIMSPIQMGDVVKGLGHKPTPANLQVVGREGARPRANQARAERGRRGAPGQHVFHD